MANDYYNNTTNIVIDGTSADAADVENKLDDVAAGFDTLQVDMDKTLNLTMTDIASRNFNITKALRSGKSLGFDAVGELTILTNDSGAAASEAEAARDIAVAAAIAAGVSEDNAADSELAASVSENIASDSADLAYEWANEAEDVVVAGGEYSAYHWAKKAEDWGTVISDSTTTLTTTWSSTEIDSEVDTRIDDRVRKFGDRNMFDNPSFKIRQRGANVTTSAGYIMDRWYGRGNNIGNSAVASVLWSGIEWTNNFPTLRARTAGSNLGDIMVQQQFPRFDIIKNEEYTLRFRVYMYSSAWNTGSALQISIKADDLNVRNGTHVTVLSDLTAYATSWIDVEAKIDMIDCSNFLSVGVKFKDVNIPSSTGDNIFNMGNMQLYRGEAPIWSPTNDAEERSKCERYYYAPNSDALNNEGGYFRMDVTNGVLYKAQVNFPVAMRVAPTIVAGATNGGSFTFSGFDGTTTRKTLMRATATATATGATASATFTASAEF